MTSSSFHPKYQKNRFLRTLKNTQTVETDIDIQLSSWILSAGCCVKLTLVAIESKGWDSRNLLEKNLNCKFSSDTFLPPEFLEKLNPLNMDSFRLVMHMGPRSWKTPISVAMVKKRWMKPR